MRHGYRQGLEIERIANFDVKILSFCGNFIERAKFYAFPNQVFSLCRERQQTGRKDEKRLTHLATKLRSHQVRGHVRRRGQDYPWAYMRVQFPSGSACDLSPMRDAARHQTE